MKTKFAYQKREHAKAERRRNRARAMRAEGKTLDEIGVALGGISKQRVSQILIGK